MIKRSVLLSLIPMTLTLQGAFVMQKNQSLKKIDEIIEKPTPSQPNINDVDSNPSSLTQKPNPNVQVPSQPSVNNTNNSPSSLTQKPNPNVQVPPSTNSQDNSDSLGNIGKLVFEIDFNKRRNGPYTKTMHKEDFYTYKGENLYYKNHDGSWMFGAEGFGRLSIVSDGNAKALRIKYPKGKIGPTDGGMQSLSAIPKKGLSKEDINNPRAYTLSYKVKFEKGFDWAIGGKLPGLAGGLVPSGGQLIGSHRMQNGFSARFMWHDLGVVKSGLIGYIYHPGRSGSNGQKIYGTGPYLSTANPAKNLYQRDKTNLFKFEYDKWYEIRQEIRANRPYKSDGTYKVWINGELAADFGGMKWIEDGKHGSYGVDRLFFSTFYGGGTPNYAPKNDSYARFKEIRIHAK